MMGIDCRHIVVNKNTETSLEITINSCITFNITFTFCAEIPCNCKRVLAILELLSFGKKNNLVTTYKTSGRKKYDCSTLNIDSPLSICMNNDNRTMSYLLSTNLPISEECCDGECSGVGGSKDVKSLSTSAFPLVNSCVSKLLGITPLFTKQVLTELTSVIRGTSTFRSSIGVRRESVKKQNYLTLSLSMNSTIVLQTRTFATFIVDFS